MIFFPKKNQNTASRLLRFNSFPKSGRTWVELMFAYVLHRIVEVEVQDVVNQSQRFKDALHTYKMRRVRFGHGRGRDIIHSGQDFPASLYENADIVFLFRNPRSVLVSYYFYSKYQLKTFSGTMREFVFFNTKKMHHTHTEFGITPLVNTYNAFNANKASFSSFKALFYEDFMQDTHSQLDALLRFFRIECSENILRDAVTYGSKENMSKLEQTNELQWHGLPGGDDPRQRKVRSAKTDGYKKEMDAKLLEDVNEYLHKHLNANFSRYL